MKELLLLDLLHSASLYYQQELATVQGITLPVVSKPEQKDPPTVATNV